MKTKLLGLSAAILLTVSAGYGITYAEQSVKTETSLKTKEFIVSVDNDKQIDKLVNSLDGSIVNELPVIDSYIIELPETNINALKNNPSVNKVSEAHEINTAGMKIGNQTIYSKATGQRNTHKELINSTRVGMTGAGVTVAVLDSGVGTAKNSISSLNVTHSVAINPDATTTEDRYGHGTHVTGIISGNSLEAGVAPGANIINVKLGNDQGEITEVDLLLGLQWVYDHKEQYNIKVVNLSVSSTVEQSYLESPISAAVEQLWHGGVTVVTAAGNSLSDKDNVNFPPANDPFVITVGALNGAGETSPVKTKLAEWSRKGITSEGIAKPELNAPGVTLASYLPSENAELALAHPESVISKKYMEMSGTSMAAPVVTGAVALLLEANPELTPNQIKYVLNKASINTGTAQSKIINVSEAISLVKNKKFMSELELGNYNQYQYSKYFDPKSKTVDYEKAGWVSLDWLKAAWRTVDWTKAAWRDSWNLLGENLDETN